MACERTCATSAIQASHDENLTQPSSMNASHPPSGMLVITGYTMHQSKIQVHDGDQVHLFLQKHFLHWLEAVSLKTGSPKSSDT